MLQLFVFYFDTDTDIVNIFKSVLVQMESKLQGWGKWAYYHHTVYIHSMIIFLERGNNIEKSILTCARRGTATPRAVCLTCSFLKTNKVIPTLTAECSDTSITQSTASHCTAIGCHKRRAVHNYGKTKCKHISRSIPSPLKIIFALSQTNRTKCE